MAQISRSTKIGGGTTLGANTLARATDVETDVLALFNAHNNHDSGSSKWTTVQSEGSSTVPLTANNSSGTQNIVEFKDNGTNVHVIADGGNETFTGKLLGPDGTAALPTYSFSSSNNNDNGLYLAGNNNPAVSASGTKVMDWTSALGTLAVPLAMSSQKITGLAAGTANGDAIRYEQLQIRQALVIVTSTTAATTTSASYVDSNLSASITPTSASSRILIFAVGTARNAATSTVATFTLARGSTDLAAGSAGFAILNSDATNMIVPIHLATIDSPATTSATTYKVRLLSNGGGSISFGSANVTQVMILAEIV